MIPWQALFPDVLMQYSIFIALPCPGARMRTDFSVLIAPLNFLYFQDLLEAVVPFDILLDRRKRANFLRSIENNLETCMKPKVVQDAGLALASLVICEEALERELIISASYVLVVHYHLPLLHSSPWIRTSFLYLGV